MLTLYFAPGSSSFAVHIALHEIGVPFEGKPMSFKKDDMRSPGGLSIPSQALWNTGSPAFAGDDSAN